MLENHAMELYKLMAPIVGTPWTRIVLHGDVSSSSYQFDFYFLRHDGEEYIKCFDAAPLNALFAIYAKMAKVCRGSQAELRHYNVENRINDDIWSGFTFVLTNDGDFTIHYEYGERSAGLSKEWKAKYLI